MRSQYAQKKALHLLFQFVQGRKQLLYKQLLPLFYRKGEEVVYKEVAFFLAQTETEYVKLSFEHIGYAWLSYENAYKKLTFNTSKELLRKANQFICQKPPV